MRRKRHGAAIPLGAALLLVMASACAAQHDEIVRSRAADDLDCPAQRFELVDHPDMRDTYKVRGCDRSEVYQVRCNVVGMCRTADSQKLAREAAQAARHRD